MGLEYDDDTQRHRFVIDVVFRTVCKMTAALMAKIGVRVVKAASAARKSHLRGSGRISAATSAYVCALGERRWA